MELEREPPEGEGEDPPLGIEYTRMGRPERLKEVEERTFNTGILFSTLQYLSDLGPDLHYIIK
jgi:hypothetical protein